MENLCETELRRLAFLQGVNSHTEVGGAKKEDRYLQKMREWKLILMD